MKQRSTPKALGWWEPRWSFAPRELHAFRKAFTPKACLRIAMLSAITTIVFSIVVELTLRPALPALQFNWPKAFAESIAMMAVGLAMILCLCVTVPNYISVSSKRILIRQGDYAQLFTYDDIRAVHLVLRTNGRHFMRFETNKTSRRIGISSKVSIHALADHVGEKIVIHDRRRDENVET